MAEWARVVQHCDETVADFRHDELDAFGLSIGGTDSHG